MKNRSVKVAVAALLAVVLVSGCGSAAKNTSEQTKNQKETAIKEADLKDVVTGIQDHYVLQNAKDIDYLHGVEYDKTVVKSVAVDAADVKEAEKGTYAITYTVKVDTAKLADAETKKTADQKKTSEKTGDEKLTDVELKKEITVVDEEEAKKLADQDEIVWSDKNETVAKSDGAKVEEKQEASAETDDAKKDSKSEEKTETKKETAKADTKKETTKAETPKKETTKKNEAKADTPKKDTHTHNYSIPITKTVHHDEVGHNEPIYTTVTDYEDQPVYATKVVCGCGAQFNNDDQWELHCLDTGCRYGYSVRKIQVGSNRVAVGSHQEQTGTKWVVDRAAYDETVTTGYKCSCGATK